MKKVIALNATLIIYLLTTGVIKIFFVPGFNLGIMNLIMSFVFAYLYFQIEEEEKE